MPLIADLLERLPMVKDVNMSSAGRALWICWQGDLDQAVPQTLMDYGGMCVIQDRDQSLWYFFTTDVFLALARLAVWAQFNPLPVAVQVLPATLLLSVRREMSLSIDSTLAAQEVMVPQSLAVRVHPKTREGLSATPGLTFQETPHLQGMAPIKWYLLEADARLPYTSSQGWYALLRPLGNPLDKRFQAVWRDMYTGIEEILQRHKLKFSIHDYFVMVPLDNLRQLRIWARELLRYIEGIKGATDRYWPCVSVIIDKKGLNFNNELPNKVGIKWDNLMPDFPYMSYRNAFLLGEGFSITDLHFSAGHSSMDNWCTVAQGEAQLASGGYIPVLVSGQMMTGEGAGCFYCGMRNHPSSHCPSKHLVFPEADVRRDFGELDLESINDAFREMENRLLEKGAAGLGSLFEKDDSKGRLVRAIFEINLPVQLRAAKRLWQSGGREFPKPGEELVPPRESGKEESAAWGMLDRLLKVRASDVAAFEKEVQAAINRTPRDVRLRTLLGFAAMERGDPARAQAAWKEAETLSASGLHQAWHQFLQARLLECQNRLSEALDGYREVLRLAPQWHDAEYRRIVCRVKMGFAEQVQPYILQLVEQDPSLFNRFLIDPELERGHLIILTGLFTFWNEAKRRAEDERAQLERLLNELDAWFAPDHPVARKFRERLKALQDQTGVTNYLAFLKVIQSRPQLEKDIRGQIQKEIEDLKERYKNYLSILETIRDEAAWFPFPRILVEFNKDFNECAGIINWAFGSNFHEPEAFKRAQAYIPTIVDLLGRLEKRLRFLRVVRDTTLFVLILGRTFFWIEIACLLLCVIILPTIAVFGNEFGLGWLKGIIRANHWELQKVLLVIVSAMSLGIAALRTTLVFERKRDQLVADARAQREEMQRQRLERIKETARREYELGQARKVKPPMGAAEAEEEGAEGNA